MTLRMRPVGMFISLEETRSHVPRDEIGSLVEKRNGQSVGLAALGSDGNTFEAEAFGAEFKLTSKSRRTLYYSLGLRATKEHNKIQLPPRILSLLANECIRAARVGGKTKTLRPAREEDRSPQELQSRPTTILAVE